VILQAIDKGFRVITTYRVLLVLDGGRSNRVGNGRGGVNRGRSSVSWSGAAGNGRAASNVGGDRAAGSVDGHRAASDRGRGRGGLLSLVAVLGNGGSGSGERKGGDCVTHFDCGGWY